MMKVNQEAGLPFPGRPGYVTGRCQHAVSVTDWQMGFRVCPADTDRDQLTLDEALELPEGEP